MIYIVIKELVGILLRLMYRVRVKGVEHIPQNGSAVLCANHISNLDPLLIGSALKRPVHFMAKEEIFRISWIGAFIRKLHAFPVKRGQLDRYALKHALSVLREGSMLGIFPEGTRSKTGELGDAHSGAALMALKTSSPIIPIAIVGPYRPFRPVYVIFGTPIDVMQVDETAHVNDRGQIITQLMMDEIHALSQMPK